MADGEAEAKDRTTTVPLSIRFSSDELDRLRQEAEQAGIPVSTLVRKHALNRLTPSVQFKLASNNAPSSLPSNLAPTSAESAVFSFDPRFTTVIGNRRVVAEDSRTNA